MLCWARAGYLVAKVVMVDVDEEQNMWLLHELAKAMELGLFHMGLHSSKVRMAWAVAEHDTPRQRPVVLVRDRGQLLCSATATLSIALVDGFSDAFLQLSNAPVGRQEPQIAEEDVLTTYLITSSATSGCSSSCLSSPFQRKSSARLASGHALPVPQPAATLMASLPPATRTWPRQTLCRWLTAMKRA